MQSSIIISTETKKYALKVQVSCQLRIGKQILLNVFDKATDKTFLAKYSTKLYERPSQGKSHLVVQFRAKLMNIKTSLWR